MTKYILNSGAAKKYPQKEKAFVKEILRDLPREIRVLYCFFAQARERWEKRYEEYRLRFEQLAGEEYNIEFELAFPESFEKQVGQADVILIQGGDDHLLQYWLGQFNLKQLFQNKVVAASSAGSDALVTSFWTCDWRKCLDGLGVLPIKIIPHFDSEYGTDDPRGAIDWANAKKELEEYGDRSLELYPLLEGDYIVFNR